jgi:hypothetical protein
VIFRPPGGAAGHLDTAGDLGDAVTVIVATPDPHAPEGDISRVLLDPAFSDPAVSAGGGVRYFTVDGVQFVRAHLDTRARRSSSQPPPWCGACCPTTTTSR